MKKPLILGTELVKKDLVAYNFLGVCVEKALILGLYVWREFIQGDPIAFLEP